MDSAVVAFEFQGGTDLAKSFAYRILVGRLFRLPGKDIVNTNNFLLPTMRCTSFAEYNSFKSASASREEEISAFESGFLGKEEFHRVEPWARSGDLAARNP